MYRPIPLRRLTQAQHELFATTVEKHVTEIADFIDPLVAHPAARTRNLITLPQ